jgi:peptide-methionine (S)-S-oxide reductase
MPSLRAIPSSFLRFLPLVMLAAAVGFVWFFAAPASADATALPNPVVDQQAGGDAPQVAVLSGGCFWGVQAVFEHTKGVEQALSGYAGGHTVKPSYEQVSTGTTGHAESVKITFNPREISYGQILKIFFSVAHDPTELNRQGPDEGTQYRSAILYANADQKRVADAYIAQLDKAGVFKSRIVTQVKPLTAFYPAEGYHQDFAIDHPTNPYIAYNDLPKVRNLSRLFPALYRSAPVTVASTMH